MPRRAVKSGILAIALCSILVPCAQAMMVPVPTALTSGIARAIQDAQYYDGSCREVWRCGRYACGWQQDCRFPLQVAGAWAVHAVGAYRMAGANPIVATKVIKISRTALCWFQFSRPRLR